MARVGLRVIVGLSMALAVAMMFAPFLRSAGAQTPGALVRPSPKTLPLTTATIPNTTEAPITTIEPTTSITPPFSSASIAPTTRASVPLSRPRVSTTTSSSTSTTSTTVAPIPAGAPIPVTLPLASEPQSASISPFFSVMSGIGFASFVGLLIAQWFLTRPGRRGPTL